MGGKVCKSDGRAHIAAGIEKWFAKGAEAEAGAKKCNSSVIPEMTRDIRSPVIAEAISRSISTRARGHSFEREQGTGKMDHGGKALAGFFIACGDAAEPFKITEEVFYEMTPFGHFKVARNRARPIAFRRDHGAGAPLIQLGAPPIIVEGS